MYTKELPTKSVSRAVDACARYRVKRPVGNTRCVCPRAENLKIYVAVQLFFQSAGELFCGTGRNIGTVRACARDVADMLDHLTAIAERLL